MRIKLGKLDNLAEMIDEIKKSSDNIGAIVIFIGVVRRKGTVLDDVEILHYEAHEEIAKEMLRKIADEAVKMFNLEDVAIEHFIGDAKVGEETVYILTAAKHRKQAFMAAEYIIDELKYRVPIWKKEISSNGLKNWVKEGRPKKGFLIYINGKAIDVSEKLKMKILDLVREELDLSGNEKIELKIYSKPQNWEEI